MTSIDMNIPQGMVSNENPRPPNGVPAETAETAGTGAPVTVPYVDAESFASLVERAPGLVLVDFTADWCPPCRRLSPDIGALANERAGSLTVVKVDADEQPDLTARFSVRGLPTLMFFRDGEVVDRVIGAPSPAQLRAKVDELGQ